MAEESFQEKTEEATPKRRDESRRKGQTAKSQELNSAVVLLAALSGLYALSGMLYNDLAGFTASTIAKSHTYVFTTMSIQSQMIGFARVFFGSVGPILLVVGLAAFVVSISQVGFTMNEEALSFKPNRLDPIQGAKRIFSTRSLVELAKGILKISIVGFISYSVIVPEIPRIALLMDTGVGDILQYTGHMVFKVGMYTAMALLVLAILDYTYQRYEFNKSIKMTKQEVKEEGKQTEGDPQVRMRIRSLQRENARRRMMDEVPEADVVITNPTHFAVALKYDLDTMATPVVVAKGKNLIAQKIKEIARESGVPMVENKPLAQALFKSVEVGQGIPEDLYRAVAEVLAYVFRLKGK
ncbi:MAG: flagellar biosynthesis protein FlhB [Candidatus Latescibacteria bacterium]|jgi:flagellar biosynthesis protein FlhB|nr:flagellar biosynthesis protein FlhB [Candidatus Latescibacterota bacterium]MBT4139972.1 flagellar biosynthesis protein FlhB [Candidatus Latescibacterota bacterium]MBT5832134.1 flagellar biosynthesis protein FlhB [Candidatus Latescibacterota bacterium]